MQLVLFLQQSNYENKIGKNYYKYRKIHLNRYLRKRNIFQYTLLSSFK